MNFFKRLAGSAAEAPERAHAETSQTELFTQAEKVVVAKPRKKTGRGAIYAVRVRENFKEGVWALQAELQRERRGLNGKPKKVTDGEVMEYLLDTITAARSKDDSCSNEVPLPNDVWLCVYEIARHLQCSPAAVIERLVAEKASELGLLPRV